MIMRIHSLRFLLAFIFSILFQASFGQRSTEVQTDSSIIETRTYPEFNSIGIFNELKDKSKTYYTELYYDTKKLKEQGVFVGGSAVGKWKEFFQDGKLKREIDYDKGLITYFDKAAFPFLELQNKYKLKGDSIVKKVYSKEFFEKHVSWSMGGSYIYNAEESGNWTDEFKQKPTKFLLRYNILMDNQTYDDLIEFEIDEDGQIIPNEYEDVYGFEQLPKNSPKFFNLTHTKAIELAKKRGLTETDTIKAEAFLYWENFKSNNIYNGRFRFYVSIKTSSIKNIQPEARSSIMDKFNIYVFNPWTGEFVEKKKMKSVRSWEKVSGSSTGLIPDNE
jgi:hypothetical protein